MPSSPSPPIQDNYKDRGDRSKIERHDDRRTGDDGDRKRLRDDERDEDQRRDDRRRKHKSSKRGTTSKHRDRKSKHRHRSKSRKRRSRSYSSDSSSSSSSSSSQSSSSSDSSSRHRSKKKSKKSSTKPAATDPSSTRLLSKLSSRNETLEEREERRAKRRAARIQARFGYTPEENPFRDPNLHEVFTWKKKEEMKKDTAPNDDDADPLQDNTKRKRKDNQEQTFLEIEKVRQRRIDRELHLSEMERLRAEEAKMKELENYDEWARKEEEFHLQQQRQRSAIRLVEGRERPVDVLAQNMLLFGMTGEEKENRARVKYREKYNVLEELENLETNLEEPYALLKDLKLGELEELLIDVDAFMRLEREALGGEDEGVKDEESNPVIRYWAALHTVTLDEIQYLKTGGESGTHASLVHDIKEMFQGQSMSDLQQMKRDIEQKLRGTSAAQPRFDENGIVDTDYWQTVLAQLEVHLAKMELSEIHSKMLVKQLEKLEAKREELRKKAMSGEADAPGADDSKRSTQPSSAEQASALPYGVEPDFGNLEEELGLDDEIDLHTSQTHPYAWQDKYRPRKPRYFNRVKTGYDWNAYNKTHYDHDNPPPKIVQGYKFNIFYPDLIDKTKTPQYFLERADTDDFCILRFSAGPPYEDVAFKIINRQWNKSRKRGFRCTFERGVLSLYFNFQSHWYRR
ncbi:hypothetical protein HJC23_002923 [Cyclotella cryptica]|uniref:Splicing factor Cactin n=1 Tax=Cyclotella cryptica TaxID=29204 RepID=A0ABD3PR52_9STRA|eukprot:CCRYP_012444-RA/>CCRYP_012444-RA protein AED:0.04 eAED:0.04 QI:0/-1/0/1/-1/1/1/0/684